MALRIVSVMMVVFFHRCDWDCHLLLISLLWTFSYSENAFQRLIIIITLEGFHVYTHFSSRVLLVIVKRVHGTIPQALLLTFFSVHTPFLYFLPRSYFLAFYYCNPNIFTSMEDTVKADKMVICVDVAPPRVVRASAPESTTKVLEYLWQCRAW